LLSSGFETDIETTFVARQQIFNKQEQIAVAGELLGEHVPAAMDTQAKIEELSETVFSTRSVQKGFITRTPA
jgi:hypothetical protein